MAFHHIEIDALRGGTCPSIVDIATVPVLEMELLAGRLVEKAPSKCCTGRRRKSTTDSRTAREFLSRAVGRSVANTFHAQLATHSVADSDSTAPLTNHDVIAVRSRCVKVERDYNAVALFVQNVRDWYVLQNIEAEAPPKMPHIFRGTSTGGLKVVRGNGAEVQFSAETLRTYLSKLSLSRQISPAEIDRLVKEVEEDATSDLGAKASTRQILYYTLSKLQGIGVTVKQPAAMVDLSASELDTIGRRGHIYQLSPELFWRLHDLII